MRGGLAIVVVVLLLAGCAGNSDLYPMPSGPPNASQRNPAAVGQTTNAILIYMEVRPGDRIELLGAEPIGSFDGATVTFLLSRPVIDADGDHTIGLDFEPLEGAVVTAVAASPSPDNTVGIAAELTATRPGRFEVTDVRLRYKVNGGSEQVGQGIDVVWTVCADDPKPADCPE
jgi:hypothetical protein